MEKRITLIIKIRAESAADYERKMGVERWFAEGISWMLLLPTLEILFGAQLESQPLNPLFVHVQVFTLHDME